MRIRQLVLAEIRTVARRAAFQEIATPALEYEETLLGQGGEETRGMPIAEVITRLS